MKALTRDAGVTFAAGLDQVNGVLEAFLEFGRVDRLVGPRSSYI